MQRFNFHLLLVLSLFASKIVLSQTQAPILHPIDNTDGDHSFTVMWDSVSGDDVSYYLAIDFDEQFQTHRLATFGPITSTIIGFQRKGTYFFRVFARSNEGTSDWSNIQSVTVTEDPLHYMTSKTGVYGESGSASFKTLSLDFYDDYLGWVRGINVTINWDSTGNEYTGGSESWSTNIEPFGIVNFYLSWLKGGFFGEEYAKYFYSSIPSPSNIDSKSDVLSTYFELFQNCPNPFNSVTVISYQLSMISEVELNVYDFIGRKLITLINEKQKPDSYEVVWDASGFKPAIYFCELRTRQRREVMKMILMQ